MSLTHHQIEELLGAFALDAVDDDERDVVEAHLAGCPRCRAEVEGHRETAALLAHGGERAPEAVWERIAEALDEAPPVLDLDRIAPLQPGAAVSLPTGAADDLAERRAARAVPRSVSLRVAAATMAVAAGLALFLGVALGRNDNARLERLEQLADDIEDAVVSNAAFAALGDPENERVTLASTDGQATAQVVRRPDGRGYLVPGNLAALPPGRVYQLWAVRTDARGLHLPPLKISLGVLGPSPDISAFQMAGPVAAYALTEEVAGGVETTTNQPVVVGYVKA